jgi:hypothetical protein
VIAIKVRGFKPGRGDGFLREIKIRSTPSFVVKGKPSAACCKILRHVQYTLEVRTKMLQKLNSLPPSQIPPSATQRLLVGLPERALVDES